jgi:hypothetical protein
VVHLVRPTGARAANLQELREGISEAPAGSLFHHAVQPPLRAPSAEEPGPDDFSAWLGGVLQDRETAERVSLAVQHAPASAEALRAALLAALDRLPEPDRRARVAPTGGEFVFLTVDSVPIPTGFRAESPAELADLLAEADPSAWFYHLIEQPWFAAGRHPLADWLRAHGAARLADWIAEESAEGHAPAALRRRVLRRWRRSRIGARLADAAAAPDAERREAGRAAVASLVRRITHPEPGE